MTTLNTNEGSYTIKKNNKSSFAVAINFKDNNGDNRHITLCFIKNFPMNNGKVVLSKLRVVFGKLFSIVLEKSKKNQI